MKRKYKENLFKGSKSQSLKNAKRLRKRLTKAEEILWEELRNRKLGAKFRRQHPLIYYVADFYCHEKGLVIEVDGPIHDKKHIKEKDRNRTAELEKLGLKVIRVRNEEVEGNLEGVLERIRVEIETSPL